MAYVNVKDWSVDQVTEWLKGLDNVIAPYSKSFLNNGVKGHQLLSLRSDDLEHLGVITLGHQEIILEAVEHLRNFHYELDKENLQMLALRLSCAASSLSKELSSTDDNCTMVPTQTMSDVHNVITAIKPLVCWLDRSPFRSGTEYVEFKAQLLQLSFEMATSAHRDIFSEKPLRTIRNISKTLANLADHIIQEMSDPMILQPASLALATLKKKEQEIGFFLLPINNAIHQIVEIKYGSPAHVSSKIEEGDEIVQVNYQTVVGWQRKKVVLLLQESPPEIVLTLKKRPRHTKVYGQIYMKPYRLPSKKRATPYSRWNDNLPSPQLLAIHDLPIPPTRVVPPVVPNESETETSSSSDSEPLDSPLDSGGRVYPLKPRPVLQRRNTITGASPTSKRPSQAIEQYWKLLQNQAASKHSSSYNIQDDYVDDTLFLRDKSVSCSHGLELSPRPTTVIGISPGKNSNIPTNFKSCFQEKTVMKKKVNFEENKKMFGDTNIFNTHATKPNTQKEIAVPDSNLNYEQSVSVTSLSSLSESLNFIDEGEDITDRSNMKVEWQKEIIDEIINNINFERRGVINFEPRAKNEKQDTENQNIHSVSKDSSLADVHVHNIIKKFDTKRSIIDDEASKLPKPKVFPRRHVEKPPEIPQKPDSSKKPAVPPRNSSSRVRGTLSKSHSTPAYDQMCDYADPVAEQLPPIPEKLISASHGDTDLNTVPIPHKETEIGVKNDFTDDSSLATVQYELGIPILEPNSTLSGYYLDNYSSTAFKHPYEVINEICINDYVSQSKINQQEDIPPKPPPRSAYMAEINKPKYPLDSPKPTNLIINRDVPQTPFFSYSESHKAGLDGFENPSTKYDLENFPQLGNTSDYQLSNELTSEMGLVYPSILSRPLNSKLTSSSDNLDFSSLKSFEPKSVSTPIVKHCKIEFPEVDASNQKNMTAVDHTRSETKISPTNSVVRAMIYSNKNKAAKKKNTLIAKRRKVGAKDLAPGDLQGYLFQRLRSKHSQKVHWEKRWFVLTGNHLYGFKSKDSSKAECLIFLSGFTVSVASEVKSRTNAFKVYHTGTVFYFSAEDSEALTSWIELITAATLQGDSSRNTATILYSETDESDTEKPKNVPNEKPSEPLKKFGSLKKFTASKNSASAQNGSSSLDRKWFFNKSNSIYKNSLPVPTEQFRSYRKIPFNNPNVESISTGNFTSHIPNFSPRFAPPDISQTQNVSASNLVEDLPKRQGSEKITVKAEKDKARPVNYIHASNPNLCDISTFHMRNFNELRPFQQCSDNLAGFVTLEELMNRQSEEQKLNPHLKDDNVPINPNLIRPDVVYGELPIRHKESESSTGPVNTPSAIATKLTHSRTASNCSDTVVMHSSFSTKKLVDSFKSVSSCPAEQHDKETTSFCFGKRSGSVKKQKVDKDTYGLSTYPKSLKTPDNAFNKSLPRTHKLQQSFQEKYSESKKLLRNKEYSASSVNLTQHNCEMVYCPQIVNDVQFAQNRSLDGRAHKTKITKQNSLTSADKKDVKAFNCGESREKFWLDSLRRSDKVSDKNSSKIKLKSATQYTPMSLPMNSDQKGKLNPKFAFELNLDEKANKSGKFKSLFTKQTDVKKEKTLLGSPKLHRAVFGKQNSISETTQLDWSLEPNQLQRHQLLDGTYSLEDCTPTSSGDLPPLHVSPTTDYPGLEYPPVFEPEIYSLADPQSSITLLRKQDKNK